MGGDQRGNPLAADEIDQLRKTCSEVCGSRLPVGSSASRSRGRSRGRGRWRCAAARRPKARPGDARARSASPSVASRSRARACRRLAARAEDQLRNDDVLERRELGQQLMELVDEADLLAPERVRSASESVAQSWPLMMTRPLVGDSSRPVMCSSVDLPAPEGPTSATAWPGERRGVDAASERRSRASPWRKERVDAARAAESEQALCGGVGVHGPHSYRSASTGSSLDAFHDG